jgi:hypothetical protein
MLPTFAPVAPYVSKLIPFDQMEHHPLSEQLVQLICNKTNNPNPLFFRVVVGYYFCMAAATMRTTIATHDKGDIPVNMYALALGPSGTGKTLSCNIMKDEVLSGFIRQYKNATYPVIAQQNVEKIALFRAQRDSIDPDLSLVNVQREFESCGVPHLNFQSATSAAILQHRHALLMAKAGALNLEIDEIGSNLLGETGALAAFLVLYDVGLIGNALRVHGQTNIRKEEIDDRTPTNMLLFGVPTGLLDGDKTEKEFYKMLSDGYARRCFFGYSSDVSYDLSQTPDQIYASRTDPANTTFIDAIHDHFENLAMVTLMYQRLTISEDATKLLIEYELLCNKRAVEFGDHEDTRAKEMSHRHAKVLKLAGGFAFVDQSAELLEKHLFYAIKLAEEAGVALNTILTREETHVKLAKYIVGVNTDLTQADLVQALPFYRGKAPEKAELTRTT